MQGGEGESSHSKAARSAESQPPSPHAWTSAENTRSGCGGPSARELSGRAARYTPLSSSISSASITSAFRGFFRLRFGVALESQLTTCTDKLHQLRLRLENEVF